MASYKKLKSGWQYRISYKDGDKYRTKSGSGYHTKKEAEYAARQIEDKIAKGYAINDNPVFVDYMEEWYRTFKQGKYSLRNDHDIELSIHTARKFFKNTKIKSITRKKYQEFINWYGENHASASVRKVHTYTKQCLQDAYNDRLIERDPTYRITARGKKSSSDEGIKFLNENETHKLIDELLSGINPKLESRYMILIAIATGMRFSEILALTWDDIDFKQHTISVTKSYDYTGAHRIKETKTKSSVRTITVDNQTLHLLRTYQIATRKLHSEYLFIDGSLSPTVSNTGANKMLHRCCQRAGIKQINFHGLRHTHCSLLLYKGVNIKYISKRLGHSDVSTTYSIYSHVIDEMERKENERVVEVMDRLMNAK